MRKVKKEYTDKQITNFISDNVIKHSHKSQQQIYRELISIINKLKKKDVIDVTYVSSYDGCKDRALMRDLYFLLDYCIEGISLRDPLTDIVFGCKCFFEEMFRSEYESSNVFQLPDEFIVLQKELKLRLK